MKIGRNDPCPCGSGNKFKKCCLSKKALIPFDNEGLNRIKVQQIASEIEAQGVTNEQELFETLNARLMIESQSANHSPRDDFHSLSPHQMQKFLYEPFEVPGMIQFNPILSLEPAAPAAFLLGALLDALANGPIRSTTRGNLPVKVVAAIVEKSVKVIKEEPGFSGIGSILTEENFAMLHKTRIVSGLAGLVLLRKKQFQMTAKCKKLLSECGMKAVYPEFLKSYISKFNWGFHDLYEKAPIIQLSAMFTLYLFKRYANQKTDNAFYEEAFINAFPAAIDEVGESPFCDKQTQCKHCYSVRMLERFAHYCGFIEMRPQSNNNIEKTYTIRVLPLLDDWVRFSV